MQGWPWARGLGAQDLGGSSFPSLTFPFCRARLSLTCGHGCALPRALTAAHSSSSHLLPATGPPFSTAEVPGPRAAAWACRVGSKVEEAHKELVAVTQEGGGQAGKQQT